MSNVYAVSGRAGAGKDTFAKALVEALSSEGLPAPQLYAFAAPLKEFARAVFFLSGWQVNDVRGKEERIDVVYHKSTFREKFELSIKPILKNLVDKNLVHESTLNPYHMDMFFDLMMEELHQEIVRPGFFTRVKYWLQPDKEMVHFNTTPRILLQKLGTEYFRGHILPTIWTDLAPRENVIFTDMRFENEYHFIKSLSKDSVVFRINRGGVTLTSSTTHASEAIDKLSYDWIIDNTGSYENLIGQAASFASFTKSQKEQA